MLCDYSAQLQCVCVCAELLMTSIRKLHVFMTSASFALGVGRNLELVFQTSPGFSKHALLLSSEHHRVT